MSYQVLARKWRPQMFKEVIGQPHVLTALENGLTQDRVHHAYLFSGTRGVGKTTIARILAKSLNCEVGVTATPCGKCANCKAIDQGRFVDLLEVDAASRTKVDDTRELLDNVQYKPAQGRYKVYLIDEVHMLSKSSFNALLKTLEEPPEYVKFLLATTDPQKLPITVLSRCLQFHLKAILPEQIERQLAVILTHEKATFEQGALALIAKAADGSMRDALSLTDQALAFGAGDIKHAAVLKMLGTIDQSHLHYLLHFIASGNSQKVFDKIKEFVHLGADFSALHQELASLCHQIALIQLQPNANVTDKTAVQLLAERLTPEEVQLFYQIALQGYKDYPYAPNGKIALEMTVMRLLAFKPANYVDIDESILLQNQNAEIVNPQITSIPQPITHQPADAVAIVNQTTIAPVDLAIPDTKTMNADTAQSTIGQPTITDATVPSSSTLPHVSTPSDLENAVINNEEQIENTLASSSPLQSPQALSQEQSQQASSQAPTLQHEPSTPSEQTSIHERDVLPVVDVEHADVEKNIIQPKVATSPSQPINVTPTIASSNSRNMLRSHRLKREELKKTEAAIDLPKSNDQSVASVTATPSVSPNIVKQVSELTPELVETEKTFDDKRNNAQELPPLSSYQTQSTNQHYEEYEPAGFNPSGAEPIYEAISNVHPSDIVNAKPEQPYQHETSIKAASKPIETPVIPLKTPRVFHDISKLNQTDTEHIDVVFSYNDNEKNAEIDIANYVDNKMTDPWFLAIKAMQLIGFEKLLAKNSVMQQSGKNITLTLHSPQQHLANNQSLCAGLKEKLRHYYGQDRSITIEVGSVTESHTPIALELIVYQQYLDAAKVSIKNDPLIQIFVKDYAVKVYENSVVPL